MLRGTPLHLRLPHGHGVDEGEEFFGRDGLSFGEFGAAILPDQPHTKAGQIVHKVMRDVVFVLGAEGLAHTFDDDEVAFF